MTSPALESMALSGTVNPVEMEEHARTLLKTRGKIYISGRNQNTKEEANGGKGIDIRGWKDGRTTKS